MNKGVTDARSEKCLVFVYDCNNNVRIISSQALTVQVLIILSSWMPNHIEKPSFDVQRPGAFYTESQNRLGWKRPTRSPSPTSNLTLTVLH